MNTWVVMMKELYDEIIRGVDELKVREKEIYSLVEDNLKLTPKLYNKWIYVGPMDEEFNLNVRASITANHGNINVGYLNGNVSKNYVLRDYKVVSSLEEMNKICEDIKKDSELFSSLFKEEDIALFNNFYNEINEVEKILQQKVKSLLESRIIKYNKRLDKIYVKMTTDDIEKIIGKNDFHCKYEDSGSIDLVARKILINIFYIRTRKKF